MASSMFSGIAAQLTATKLFFARGLARWMSLASTSLPVPDSPTISTEQSVAATRRASAMVSCEDESTATGSSASLSFISVLIGTSGSVGPEQLAEGGQPLQLQELCRPKCGMPA